MGGGFGGARNGGPQRRRKPRPLIHALELSLEQLYAGTAARLAVHRAREITGALINRPDSDLLRALDSRAELDRLISTALRILDDTAKARPSPRL